jgi:hypothetical protein
VVLSAQAPLLRLMRQFEPVIDIIGPAETPARLDYHCSLMSLPHALGVTLDSLAAPDAYLTADPGLVATWRPRLPGGDRPRVGLAWTGNPAHRHDQRRSIPLGDLEPLLSAAADWICLQTDLRDGDAALMRKFGVSMLGPTDLADTAAIVSQLDLVISVDTSVAHLAGALGKPVWILLPHRPDFRWLLERTDSPWYPSARLFRQPAAGDWGPVIARARRELDRRWGELRQGMAPA